MRLNETSNRFPAPCYRPPGVIKFPMALTGRGCSALNWRALAVYSLVSSVRSSVRPFAAHPREFSSQAGREAGKILSEGAREHARGLLKPHSAGGVAAEQLRNYRSGRSRVT